jgi:hypothetical protein
VINNNTNCRFDVFNLLATRLIYTAVVPDIRSCPHGAGPTINVERSSFLGNGTAISVPLGVTVCVIDSTMKDNGKGIEVR